MKKKSYIVTSVGFGGSCMKFKKYMKNHKIYIL